MTAVLKAEAQETKPMDTDEFNYGANGDLLLFDVWCRSKNINMTKSIGGTPIQNRYLDARAKIPNYNLAADNDLDYEKMYHVCFYLLYKKFRNQLNKKISTVRQVKITGTTEELTIDKMPIDDVKEPVCKITKRTIYITEQENLQVFRNDFLIWFAQGLFPVAFLSKMFNFINADGVQYSVSMKSIGGNKTLKFSRKLQDGYDYNIKKGD